MIDLEKLHPSCKEFRFKYASLSDIYDRNAPKQHAIMLQRQPRGKWTLAGNADGPFLYPTEKDARADLQRLRDWQGSKS